MPSSRSATSARASTSAGRRCPRTSRRCATPDSSRCGSTATSAATAATRSRPGAGPVPRRQRPAVGGRRRHRRAEARDERLRRRSSSVAVEVPVGRPTRSRRSPTTSLQRLARRPGAHPQRPVPGDARVGHRGPRHLRGRQPARPHRHAMGLRRRRRPAPRRAAGRLPPDLQTPLRAAGSRCTSSPTTSGRPSSSTRPGRWCSAGFGRPTPMVPWPLAPPVRNGRSVATVEIGVPPDRTTPQSQTPWSHDHSGRSSAGKSTCFASSPERALCCRPNPQVSAESAHR